jgi:hypothetical protein
VFFILKIIFINIIKMTTLSNVRYSSILPMGKTGDYSEEQKVQFEMPPDIGYIDGKQSYIYMEVENTSTVASSSTGAAQASAHVPVMLQPHLGASALVRRMQLTSKNGVELEDIDGYNTYVGMLNSYTHDRDEYQAMGLVEGVVGHSALKNNRSVLNPAVHYFSPQPDVEKTDGEAIGGNVSVTASFCMPIHLGLFSGLGDSEEKQAYPNLPIGGSILNLYLEQAKVAMAEQASAFYRESADGDSQFNYKDASELVDLDDFNSGDTILVIKKTEHDFDSDSPQFRQIQTQKGEAISCFKQGSVLDIYESDGTTFAEEVTVKDVKVSSSGDQLELTLTAPATTTTAGGKIRYGVITPKFNISKIELRVLETVPANPGALRAAVNKGINYKSVLLNKLSQASALKNSILNIPASMTRALSIFTAPCIQDDLETFTGGNETNSLVYPQVEAGLQFDYQYQVRQFLIPNRKVTIANVNKNANDNAILYQQLQMAFRPVKDARCLNDTIDGNTAPLSNPVCIPLMLAPVGSSYKLLDSEPQLRYTSSNAASTKAKLFHIYVNHVRTLKANASTGAVEVIM